MPRFSSSLSGTVERYSQIDRLQKRVRGLLEEIEEIYAQIRRVASETQASEGRKPKARADRPARAKRGALRAAIYKVLAGGKAITPAEIVRALPRVGFRSASKPRVLYTSVYLSLRKDKNILKTREGFRIKSPSAIHA